jgi:hypothetical protein
MQVERRTRSTGVRIVVVALAGLTALTAVLEAQAAIFITRRVLGRVESMSQQSPQQTGASYDSASVMLEAPAQKVYETAVSALRKAQEQGITITREDPSQMLVQFTNGKQIAGLRVSSLADKLSQMLITSAHSGPQPNAAALVSDSVLRVCREMSVECSRAQQ